MEGQNTFANMGAASIVTSVFGVLGAEMREFALGCLPAETAKTVVLQRKQAPLGTKRKSVPTFVGTLVEFWRVCCIIDLCLCQS